MSYSLNTKFSSMYNFKIMKKFLIDNFSKFFGCYIKIFLFYFAESIIIYLVSAVFSIILHTHNSYSLLPILDFQEYFTQKHTNVLMENILIPIINSIVLLVISDIIAQTIKEILKHTKEVTNG